MRETRVYLLDLGSMALPESSMFWGSMSSKEVRFPIYGVLIDHQDGKFLYDTGFDKAHIDALMPGNARQTSAQTLIGQLDLIGLRPEDITHVMNSHYHIDHVGGNKFCSKATTVCHACELEAAAKPDKFEELGYSDLTFAPSLRDAGNISDYANDIYTPRFEVITGDQEIAKGITLLETPGHTPGHYSLMVNLRGRRPMLFTGDACYERRNMEDDRISNAHVDVRQSFKSLDRLRDLSREHEAEIFYSHDASAWRGWRPAPAYYA